MNNYFAENLKYLREEKGWSQSELSRQTVRVCNIHNKDVPEEKHIKPITQASIARWEAGENSPSIDNLVVLEETLFVRLPDLIGKNLKDNKEEKVKLSKEQEKELQKLKTEENSKAITKIQAEKDERIRILQETQKNRIPEAVEKIYNKIIKI